MLVPPLVCAATDLAFFRKAVVEKGRASGGVPFGLFRVACVHAQGATQHRSPAAMCALLVGDVRKLIDDLNYCADHGKLARKKVLFNFISDAVRSVRLDGRGVIYHESTHRMFGMIKHYGGPRTHRFIQGNLAGMHLRTTERRCVKERCALCGIDHGVTTMLTVFMLPALNRWIKNMHHYDLGINEPTFQYLATFYTSVLNALDIGLGLVFCECSEDESACQDDPRWNERRDELVGF